MNRPILFYGGIGSAIAVLLTAIHFVLAQDMTKEEFNASSTWGHVAAFLALAVMLIPMLKQYQNGEDLRFGSLFKLGFFIALIQSVIFGIVSALFYWKMMPPAMDALRQEAMVKAEEEAGSDGADMAASMMDFFFSPTVMGGSAFIGRLFYGTILAIVVAAILSYMGSKSAQINQASDGDADGE